MDRPNVVMLSPGFPDYMQHFTRALDRVGARVIGIGDGAEENLPEAARASLAAYLRVHSYRDEAEVAGRVGEVASRVRIHRIECLWEPYMLLAAGLRERFGVPGMTVAETVPFRDKEVMKQVLDRAGIRTPRHASATTVEGVWDAAERVGYPLVVKPIAGAGSESTYRVDSPGVLEEVLPRLRAVPEVSVEEFVEGDDYTFDAISVDGEIRYLSMAVYRPRALVARENEWISPQTVVLRDVDAPELDPGRRMGEEVLRALGFRTGFTHMEWYRTPGGEAVFGEIAARPPGAHLVDLMNFASDTDTYAGWAEAAVHGRFTQRFERRYNAAFVFKRARGSGRIRSVEGLEPLLSELGPHLCVVNLNPVGSLRRDWRQTLVGDGMVILRHPDLDRCLEMADRVGTRLHLNAG